MSLQWADFPSGQHGLYGLNAAAMLNGTPWVTLAGDDLAIDPDGSIGSAGVTLYVQSTFGSNIENMQRLALTTPHQKVGIAFRAWLLGVPTNRPLVITSTTGNVVKYNLCIRANGGLELRDGNSTVVATADYPILLANSWNHIEVNFDYVTGVCEVRKNGVTIPELSDTFGSPPGGTCGHIGFRDGYSGAGSSDYLRIKDLVVYNGAGSQFNSFLGQVSVGDLYPDGDNDLNWTPSSGSTGYDLIKDNTPGNRLTITGVVSADETVKLNTTYYKWTSGSVDTGTPAGTLGSPWLVNLGASAEESLDNLNAAINASGTPGTTYSTALTAHATLECVGNNATQLEVEPIDGSTIGASCTETMANGSWQSSTVYQYGPSDTSEVSAGFTTGPVYPDPSKFTLSDLDPDVTSVKGLLSIVRAFKSDGGDGSLQVSLSPNDVDWDDGADNPLTTAATYYYDTSEVSPDTAAAWTPAEVNAALLKLNRTL